MNIQNHEKITHIEMNAPAKLNLSLDITGRRADGYHTVDMIMQSIALYDTLYFDLSGREDADSGSFVTLTIEHDPGSDVSRREHSPQLSAGPDNLIVRAACLIRDKAAEQGRGIPGRGLNSSVDIRLIKRIPMAAGLAGGSTDAAATLLAVNTLLETGYTDDELMELGLRLGADIPYCLMAIRAVQEDRPTTCRARGIGEELTPLPSPDKCHVLLAKPGISISTAWSYTTYDQSADHIPHPDMDICCDALKLHDPGILSHLAGNVLEAVALNHYPEIGTIEQIMNDHGAALCLMSGSGPTVYGLFREKEQALSARDTLSKSGLLTDSTDGSCALVLTETL